MFIGKIWTWLQKLMVTYKYVFMSWYRLITLSKPSNGWAGISSGDAQEDRAAVKKALASGYKSNLAHKVKAELLLDSGNEFQIASDQGKKLGRWRTTWLQQFSLLLRRCVKERRHESFSSPRVARVLVLAFFAGLLWWQSDPANIQDRVSDAFFRFSIIWTYNLWCRMFFLTTHELNTNPIHN